jgi:DNA-binding transcriptional LysR family regulator
MTVMDSTDLNIFKTVAVAGGIGRAATELNTVQSNVTQHIRALELQLGVQLFHRSKKGVTLTSTGNRLLPYAMRIDELLMEARRAVSDDAEPSGELRIGSLETTAALRLPPILTAYSVSHRGVDLAIETGPTEALIERVLSRKLDGAFVAGPIDHFELVAIPIVEEELVLITPPAVATRQQLDEYLSAANGRKALVFRSGCSYRQRLAEFLAHNGFVDLRWMELGTLDGIIGCVASSVGISLLPRGVVASAVQQGQIGVHALKNGIGRATTVFVYRQDMFVSSALRGFLACAREQFSPPA